MLTLVTVPYVGIYDYPLMVTASLAMLYKEEGPVSLRVVLGTLLCYFSVILHATVLNVTGLMLTPLLMILAYALLDKHKQQGI